MLKPRNEHACCTYQDRYVIVSGSEYQHTESADTSEMYDTVKNTWELLPNLKEPRWGHASCAAGNKVFVFCGRSCLETAKDLASIEVLDLKNQVDGWNLLPTVHVKLRAQQYPSAISVGRDEILILENSGNDR